MVGEERISSAVWSAYKFLEPYALLNCTVRLRNSAKFRLGLDILDPTIISETSQGGAIPNLMVCSFGSTQTVPAGSVFHYQLIGP